MCALEWSNLDAIERSAYTAGYIGYIPIGYNAIGVCRDAFYLIEVSRSYLCSRCETAAGINAFHFGRRARNASDIKQGEIRFASVYKSRRAAVKRLKRIAKWWKTNAPRKV